MNKKKLNNARKKIDNIDDQIFNLINKRTRIVKEMMNIKKLKKQIIDHKRINEILKKIRKKSIKNKLDTLLTKRIWKSIIWSYVDYQQRKYKKNK